MRVRLKRILFLCSQNRLRSPTAEAAFSDRTDIEVASAGLDHSAEVPCTPELIAWADLVFVMEKAHRTRLAQRFGAHLRHARVVCLDVPDDFAFMQPELVALLKRRVEPHLRRR